MGCREQQPACSVKIKPHSQAVTIQASPGSGSLSGFTSRRKQAARDQQIPSETAHI